MQYAYDKLSMNKRNQNTQKGLKTVLVAQLCPTLCNPMDCSTPGFPVLHHLPELA